MREIRDLESQRRDIIIALDEACDSFRHYAAETIRHGLHVKADFTVAGDAQVLIQNAQLVRDTERYGIRTQSLIDELTDIDERLSELYHSKFDEIKKQYLQNPYLRDDFETYEQNFKVALNDRVAGNFLKNMLIRL